MPAELVGGMNKVILRILAFRNDVASIYSLPGNSINVTFILVVASLPLHLRSLPGPATLQNLGRDYVLPMIMMILGNQNMTR